VIVQEGKADCIVDTEGDAVIDTSAERVCEDDGEAVIELLTRGDGDQEE